MTLKDTPDTLTSLSLSINLNSSLSPDTNCDLDPIPTSHLKQYSLILLPTITNIITLSLSTGIFPDQFKNCNVHPHLKKYNLDKDDLGN